jgi:hypothetical protein
MQCAFLPLSVIIVGVGDGKFTDMVKLNGDNGLKDASGTQIKRDLVQFVPFSRFKDNSPEELQREVLAKIPDQITEYIKLCDIKLTALVEVDISQMPSPSILTDDSEPIYEEPESPSTMKSWLRKADLFSEPIKLHYNEKNTTSSVAGGLITVFIILILVMLTGGNFIDLFTSNGLLSQTTLNFAIEPPSIPITPKNFMFSLTVWDVNDRATFKKNAIFNVQFTVVNYIRNATTGQQILVEQSIPLKFCQPSDYPTSLISSFRLLKLEQSLCPDYKNITMVGTYSSPIYTAFKVNVSQCINGTNPYIVCAPQDYIDKYIASIPKISVEVDFLNFALQELDYYNPIIPFIDSRTLVISNDNLARFTELFWRNVNIQTQQDIFGFGAPSSQNTIRFSGEISDQIYETTTSGTNYQYLLLVFRASNSEEVYFRYYNTLGDIAASLGAYWHILVFTLGFFVYKYNDSNFKAKISRELLINEARKNTNFYPQSKKISESRVLDNSTILDISQDSEIFEATEIDTKWEDSLKFSFLEVLGYTFFPCLLRTVHQKERKQIWNGLCQHYEKESDIQFLLEKLKGGDRIKQVFTQVFFFEIQK